MIQTLCQSWNPLKHWLAVNVYRIMFGQYRIELRRKMNSTEEKIKAGDGVVGIKRMRAGAHS